MCGLLLRSEAAAQSTQRPNPNANIDEDGITPPLAQNDLSSIVSHDCMYHGAGVIRLSLVINPQVRSENVAPLYPVKDDFAHGYEAAKEDAHRAAAFVHRVAARIGCASLSEV
jgi:hypothetical protein